MDAQLNIQNDTYVSALLVAPTGVGKTHLALDLLESEYKNHFDFIIIICPTLKHNETYKRRKWVWTDPEVILIELFNYTIGLKKQKTISYSTRLQKTGYSIPG